ncbi:uncharacterized protein [Macaca nemestrina]|uniref:uncharacterized protein isoform X3 n=1 Tax=Macaca nemestrina TaxID=9545 RepID=UPI0039B9668A
MKKKNWHLCHLCPSGLTTLSSSKIDAPRRYTTLTMWIQISPAWISAWILFEKHRLATECHVVHPIKLNSASKREKRKERRESKVCDSVYHSTEVGSLEGDIGQEKEEFFTTVSRTGEEMAVALKGGL